MKVSLLYYTPDPERAIATAARLCYSEKSPSQIYFNDIDGETVQEFIKRLASLGHYSTFEHAVFTFALEDISRSCTHQLVRHRTASYNQQSQRYVKFDDNKMCSVVPKSIFNNIEASAAFNSAMNECKNSYEKLLNLGIPTEDARFVLPNACTSNIVVTMNARSLINFFKLRCCNRAQWEIKEVAWSMLKLCKTVAPNVFATAGPSCLYGQCSEGSMCCGNPYTSGDLND